jgi:hypothetical protein
VVDTFLFWEQVPLTATYKGANMLADNLFQHSAVSTSAGKQVVLYYKAEIDSISIGSGASCEPVDYSLVEYYL